MEIPVLFGRYLVKRWKIKHLVILIYVCLLSGIFPQSALADEKDGIDMVLVMDSSGSMKKTDPKTLRKPAAKLFITLLKEKDRVGVISFSDAGHPMSSLTEAAGKDNQNKLFKAIDAVSSKGLYTNIHDALKRGFEMIKLSSGKERILILMSDGKMDLGDKDRESAMTEELRTKLLPEINNAGVKIYTIAFTELSDQKLLEEIAFKTGGFFSLAKTDKDLHLIFTSIFEKIKSPDTVPMKGETFLVDENIKEVILLVSKKTPETTIAIIDPGEKRITSKRHGENIQWFESKIFDMVTIKEPLTGQWTVKFSSGEGNKVFIITNLRLMSSFNRNFVPQGTVLQVDAWLEKDKEPLKARDILQHIEVSAELFSPDGMSAHIELFDDGTHGDTHAGDGFYFNEFKADLLGEYKLKIHAEGKTFKREKVYVFKIIEPQPQETGLSDKGKKDVTTRKEAELEREFSWGPVLIKFGLINLLLIIGGVIYLSRNALKKVPDRLRRRRLR